jgi:hypothetical protein
MLMARKWAGLLNYDLYRFKQANEEGMTAISIGYPANLVESLNEGATSSKLNLQISTALHTAIQIRDGKAAGDAVALWKQVHIALDRLKDLDIKLEPYNRTDVIAGIAAGVCAVIPTSTLLA